MQEPFLPLGLCSSEADLAAVNGKKMPYLEKWNSLNILAYIHRAFGQDYCFPCCIV